MIPSTPMKFQSHSSALKQDCEQLCKHTNALIKKNFVEITGRSVFTDNYYLEDILSIASKSGEVVILGVDVGRVCVCVYKCDACYGILHMNLQSPPTKNYK